MLASDTPDRSFDAPDQTEAEEMRDRAMTSDSSGSMSEEDEGGGSEDDGLDEESQGTNDVVDDFFEQPGSVPA